MKNLVPGVRNAVRAVILEGGRLLVQHKFYADGRERFVLPGGAPEGGETLEQGLKRECREEIGADITVLRLLHVADFLKPRETDPVTYRQQVEFLFLCQLPEGYVAGNGPHPDKHQQAVLWLPVAELCHKNFFPGGLSRLLSKPIQAEPVYLGLIE
ncbi:NUDIX domain-containing protein [Aestuariispira insulae]|uniref:ADP-ribose pyrophosphatase YjhB (NUDIX family) n=1 Tax=Aestuariispira insulae TaxID=1461337 RepID=A0A3D9H8H4_9PROT|nr:NUDIX domain-containing protein [Aestuariispira insulae]RED45800.1 ADP-ribose pyrophosphatase YjhB (NUDIX family) [Aestuariispira insulae]